MNLVIPEPIKEFLRKLDKKTRKSIGAELRKFQNDEPVDLRKISEAPPQTDEPVV